MEDDQIIGKFMKISKIKEIENGDYYLDIWIINTDPRPEVLSKLEDLEQYPGTKCCWD